MTAASRPDLLDVKLRALVASRWGDSVRSAVELPAGAGLVEGGVAWVLIDADPLKAFGPALAWAAKQKASEVHLLVESQADVLARRARCFDPAPAIWQIDDTALRPAEAAAPAIAPDALPAADLAGLLVDADLEVVVEDGIVRGEIHGLEVARIVHGVTTSGVPIDEPLLEVGVGQADRELTAMLHSGFSPTDQLARVAEIVRVHRRPEAERHPLNQLVPERWLRSCLITDPDRIGLVTLRAVASAVARPNLRDTAIAMAVGETDAGEAVLVACSVGVDLDLVPAAADARLSIAPGARLLLVMPERDAHPITRTLAASLVQPAEVVPVDDSWRC